MTNPRVVIARKLIDGKWTDILDVEATKELRNRGILTDSEIEEMLCEADKIEKDYFRLRVKALIAIAKKFGKRRAEIASLERIDLKVENGKLYVTFTLRKKHKKGLFQYLKVLRRTNPEALNKSLLQIELDWKDWTKTKTGYKVKEEKRTKSVDITDKYAQIILEYLEFLEREYPDAKFLFPSGKAFFGDYIVAEDSHLSGRQLLNLVKPLNPTAWLHLFRETKGAEIAREMGMNISAVAEVRNTLDLEREETAWNYVRRYAVQELKAETEAP
jgi:integrase